MEKKVNWWKNALVYQIYPLSFNDSNHDGVGDIVGIHQKLDYLKDYGVDVIWLSPVYQSPMDDNGYDISDYDEIHTLFGSKKDLKDLVDAAHERGMKIIMDLVINHTSDEHKWFKESSKSKDNPYRDYYIWRDEPSDITSVFSGSAWAKDEKTNQYFFHLFSKRQPDLNWDNNKLQNEIFEMVNRWLDFGIDGFRLDVIDLIGKNVDEKQLGDGPFLDERLKRLYETCFKGRDIMTVGETPALSIERSRELTNPPTNYLDMVFQFSHMDLDEVPFKGKWHVRKVSYIEMKALFKKTQQAFEKEGWNSLFWSNHDHPRAVSRYGNDHPKYRVKSAQMLFVALYSMKGTPYVYQGEEIGMTSVAFESIYDYRDIETINMYNEAIEQGVDKQEVMKRIYAKSRDNSRTPFQWTEHAHGGFSEAAPWLKSNPNYKTINASSDVKDPKGVYQFTKKFFQLRKQWDVFTEGKFNLLFESDPDLFIYERITEKTSILILCNMTKNERTINLNAFKDYEVLLSNTEAPKLSAHTRVSAYDATIYIKEYASDGNN